MSLDDDPEHARELLRRSVERYYNAPLEAVAKIQAMFAGWPAEAAEWLNSYMRAGARHVIVRLAADDHHVALEKVAGQVLPLLRLHGRP
ncbi:hypothetical protein [Nonomuraea sp. NPDC052265]|uniref:hypothetical protein n=1 Tax=Nonomuraea sp. NPDC052265 TaxID=3364374 RepID=UPI0037C855AE